MLAQAFCLAAARESLRASEKSLGGCAHVHSRGLGGVEFRVWPCPCPRSFSILMSHEGKELIPQRLLLTHFSSPSSMLCVAMSG